MLRLFAIPLLLGCPLCISAAPATERSAPIVETIDESTDRTGFERGLQIAARVGGDNWTTRPVYPLAGQEVALRVRRGPAARIGPRADCPTGSAP